MNIDMAVEIVNEMIIKEHKVGNPNAKKIYSKEELLIFCKKLLLEVRDA